MNPSRSRLAILWLVPTIVSLMPAESRGWNAEGHMIVALVADRLLQARDQQQIIRFASIGLS